MNASDLKNKLLEEGCNPDNFCIGPRGAASDVYCLTKNGSVWQVYYTERGCNSKPIYESVKESEACDYYFEKIMEIRHWHVVGFFEDDDSALKIESELKSVGIDPIRNDMPPISAGGPSIRRVFVVGKDIFRVRKMYAYLPITNV